MPYVITAACICVKDRSCVAACPVDCILGAADEPMLFIDPALCIDCAACVPVCPENAIYHENEVPSAQAEFTTINREYFTDRPAALERVRAFTRERGAEEPAAG